MPFFYGGFLSRDRCALGAWGMAPATRGRGPWKPDMLCDGRNSSLGVSAWPQAMVQQFPLGIPKGAARWPPEASPSTPGVVVSSRIAVGPLLAGQGFRFFRAAPYRQTSPPLACVSPASKGGARCWGGRPDGGGMIHGMRAIIILTPGMIGHRNFFPVWAVNSGGRVSAF